MNRENNDWLVRLGTPSAEQDVALLELREALLRNLRKALSHHPRHDDAFLEDAVQESLLRILGRLDQFQGRSRFLTWATTIAIRVAMSELRRHRWKDVSLDAVMSETGFMPERMIDRPEGPAVQSDREVLLEKMHDLINTELTARQRTALVAELKGMPQDEIARHLGTNRNAIYKLTHDARKKLRAGLESAGYSADEVIATTGR